VYTGLKPSDLGLKCVVGWVGVVCLHALHGVKLTVQSAGTKKKNIFHTKKGEIDCCRLQCRLERKWHRENG
jgi:hypothetical protein